MCKECNQNKQCNHCKQWKHFTEWSFFLFLCSQVRKSWTCQQNIYSELQCLDGAMVWASFELFKPSRQQVIHQVGWVKWVLKQKQRIAILCAWFIFWNNKEIVALLTRANCKKQYFQQETIIQESMWTLSRVTTWTSAGPLPFDKCYVVQWQQLQFCQTCLPWLTLGKSQKSKLCTDWTQHA